MGITKYNLTILQGETFQLSFQLLGDGDVPIDLNGYSARLQIRQDYADFSPTVFVNLDSNNNTLENFIEVGNDGIITIQISAQNTSNINDDRCKYDLELYNTLGYVKRIIEGKISIRREVTR
jgi:hypothetical protein